jgi:Co/Zn/Cd efflux system component
MTEH